MSGFFNRIAKLVTIGSTKRLVGRDLEGNKYFELPATNGGNVKRVVEYKVTRDIADYTSGSQRLPVQWTTWLSHTRSNPPTMEELVSDRSRQDRLGPMIAAIEQREREERIRQGYLPAPDTDDGGAVGQIAGPSSSRHSGLRYGEGQAGAARLNTAPSFVPRQHQTGRDKSPKQQGVVEDVSEPLADHQREGAIQHPRDGLDTHNLSYPVPTPETPGVAPPSPTVDPSAHSSAEDLRKLSEEDTKRRIQESERKTPASQAEDGNTGQSKDGVQGVDTGGFKPRRRGGQ